MKLWGCNTKGQEISKSNWEITVLWGNRLKVPPLRENLKEIKIKHPLKKKQSIRKINHSK